MYLLRRDLKTLQWQKECKWGTRIKYHPHLVERCYFVENKLNDSSMKFWNVLSGCFRLSEILFILYKRAEKDDNMWAYKLSVKWTKELQHHRKTTTPQKNWKTLSLSLSLYTQYPTFYPTIYLTPFFSLRVKVNKHNRRCVSAEPGWALN